MTFAALLDAIFANRCVACGKSGPSCCSMCWQGLGVESRAIERVSSEGKRLEGVALTTFSAQVAQLVHAYKDGGRSSLAKQFGEALAPLLGQLVASQGSSPRPASSAPSNTYTLVPVPSQPSSIQARGFSPAALIAAALNRAVLPAWSAIGPRFRLARGLLWRVRASADQASLGQHERAHNLVDSMASSARARGLRVILIDDIVTTGATLFEACRALEQNGAEVIGFLTFSETILRKIQKTPTKTQKKV